MSYPFPSPLLFFILSLSHLSYSFRLSSIDCKIQTLTKNQTGTPPCSAHEASAAAVSVSLVVRPPCSVPGANGGVRKTEKYSYLILMAFDLCFFVSFTLPF